MKKYIFILFLIPFLLNGQVVEFEDSSKVDHNKYEPIFGNWFKVKKSGRMALTSTDAITKEKGVKNVYPDYMGYLHSEDTLYHLQWYLKNDSLFSAYGDSEYDNDVDADSAWKITVGDTNLVICIIDSGVDTTHPDLSANYGHLSENFYVDDFTFYHHGTAIAGLICAKSNNTAFFKGLADSCRYINARITSTGSFPSSSAAEAILWAINKSPILNCSWGFGVTYPPVIKAAIEYYQKYNKSDFLIGNGGVTVFSAGNTGNEYPVTPAYYSPYDPTMLSVAETDFDDVLSGSSTRNTSVDLCAPSYRTWICYPYSEDEDGYYISYGTSYAAPLVTATAALIMSKYKGYFTAEDIVSLIKNSTDTIDSKNSDYSGKYGTGRLNSYRALKDADKLIKKRNAIF